MAGVRFPVSENRPTFLPFCAKDVATYFFSFSTELLFQTREHVPTLYIKVCATKYGLNFL